MVRTKGFKQIRSSSSVKGFRSCRHSTATPTELLDRGRVQAGEAGRLWNNIRLAWRGRVSVKGGR